jgi:hypothetical protein
VKSFIGDEPIGVVIHICMEISYGNSLCSYLYLNLAKMSSFSFIFYLFFYKIREQESRSGAAGGRAGTSGREGKGGRRMNMLQIMYTHVCKCKNDTC